MNPTHINRVKKLYKTVLKLHKGLPQELQIVGTQYLRDEFKRHKKCNQQEAIIFLNEWTSYALTLAEQLGVSSIKHGKKLGKNLSEEDLNYFKEDQINQLYELLIETKGSKEETK